MRYYLFAFGICLTYLLMVASAYAQVIVKVVDQHNQPLVNAVVELETKKPISQQPLQSPFIMDQVNKSFVPEVLVVPQNSAVTFPNSDDIRHHVYSFSKAKTFELKLYAGTPDKAVSFEQSGVVVLGCNIHDAMVGYIYVSGTGNSYKTDENGQIKLALKMTDVKQIMLWHANAKQGVDSRTVVSTFDPLATEIILQLPVTEPAKRDSFEDVFSHAH